MYSTTITRMQSKIDNLTKSNIQLQEDLIASRTVVTTIKEENSNLKQNLGAATEGASKSKENESEILLTEKKKRLTAEKELEMQVNWHQIISTHIIKQINSI